MRQIGQIPHPDIRITVFAINEKLLLKLEAGPMEQIFKFTPDQAGSFEKIECMLDEKFLSEALDRFNDMYRSCMSLLDREGGKIDGNLA